MKIGKIWLTSYSLVSWNVHVFCVSICCMLSLHNSVAPNKVVMCPHYRSVTTKLKLTPWYQQLKVNSQIIQKHSNGAQWLDLECLCGHGLECWHYRLSSFHQFWAIKSEKTIKGQLQTHLTRFMTLLIWQIVSTNLVSRASVCILNTSFNVMTWDGVECAKLLF